MRERKMRLWLEGYYCLRKQWQGATDGEGEARKEEEKVAHDQDGWLCMGYCVVCLRPSQLGERQPLQR